ncbi:MAG: hypothetical protein PVG07_07300 [Acidobacteriota bacterium]
MGPVGGVARYEIDRTADAALRTPVAEERIQRNGESWEERVARWRRRLRGYRERAGEEASEIADRLEGFVDRAVERGQQLGERALQEAEDTLDRAERAGERALEELEDWWSSGSGDITSITFDGTEVTLHGTGGMSARARSGLTVRHRNNTEGLDYTQPEYQDVPDKGPVPEGDYYVEPDEVDNNPPSAAWGGHRVRLHESLVTRARRRLSTERSGGFYLHGDGGNDGTAGCIGVISLSENARIHALIEANSARIPVTVDYPEPAEAEEETGGVQRWPLEHPLLQAPRLQRLLTTAEVARRPPGPLVQRENGETTPALSYLVEAGIEKLHDDEAGGYGEHYYDTLARHLFEVALDREGGDYGEAFDRLNELQNGDLGFELQREYTALVGTDSTNGWDKFRHFAFTAYLQYHSGGILAPELFTYGKELWDAIEGVFGADPEGYSVPDIRADNRGEAFAEQMRAREIRETQIRSAEELERARRVFIDQNPADVQWFILNFGR